MSRQMWIPTLVSLGVCLGLFGLGAVTLLSMPGLGTEAQLMLPVVVLVGMLVAPYLACALARRIGSTRRKDESQLRPNVSSSRMMSSSPR